MRGTVRRYLTMKRYGFIDPEGGTEEVFFHLSNFNMGTNGPPPITNEPVEYSLVEGGTRASVVSRLKSPTACIGVVASYDPVTGYGFINVPEGQCYLHKSEVLGSLIPAIGSRVTFYTTGERSPDKSPRACYVMVLT